PRQLIFALTPAVSSGRGQASPLGVRPSRRRGRAARHRNRDSSGSGKIPFPTYPRSAQGRIRIVPAPLAESATRRRRTRIGQVAPGKTSAVVPGQIRRSISRLPAGEARQETLVARTLARLLFRASGHRGPQRAAL